MTYPIQLKQTCFASPEQYDALIDGEVVGYLRLRHGCFTVDYPDVHGQTILEESTSGDGAFDEEERPFYLNMALEAIRNAHRGALAIKARR